MKFKRRAGRIAPVLITIGIAGAACGGEDPDLGVTFEAADVKETSKLARMLDRAADEFGVPADVLKAVVEVETGFEPSIGEVEFEGQEETFGLFALRGEELRWATDLVDEDIGVVKTDDEANVRAGAALLRAYAERAGLTDTQMKDPLEWGPAVAQYGQLDEDLAGEYVEQVMALVAEGAAIPVDDGGTVIIRGQGMDGGEFGSSISGLRSAANTRWLPSPNYSSRGGSAVKLVVIHTCEGSYASCVSWLRQRRAGASAHYVVREDGRRVAQLVDENKKAWHIAANYRSWLNGGRLSSRNGWSTNVFSIGIEHGGRASQRRWPSRQISRSISLVRNITRRHGIPRDRYHIVGHGKLQPENRYDPGPNWPWSSYLRRIRGTRSVRVDNEWNARFQASGNWHTSSWASGKINHNYRYRRPANQTDNAKYKVRLPTGGRWQVYARSPGNGYNTRIRYVIHHRGGRKVVARNMSSRGASWVSLGTYRFAKGDAWRVEVASRTSGHGFIIADAIKFVKR